MKLGVGLGHGVTVRLAQAVEDLGFDSVWASDHLAGVRPMQDGLVSAAVMVGATRRITVGTCVYLLPLRSPGVTAKATTVLSDLADGRFVLGVGLGGENPKEYDIADVPLRHRGPRADEAIALIRQAFNGEPVNFRGRFTRVEDVRFTPARPFPILVGGRSVAAQNRAARLGDGYLPYLFSPDRVRAARKEIEGTIDRDWSDFRYVVQVHIAMRGAKALALTDAQAGLSSMFGAPAGASAEKLAVFGTPDECKLQLQAFADAGVNEVILSPLGGAESLEAEITALAREFITRS